MWHRYDLVVVKECKKVDLEVKPKTASFWWQVEEGQHPRVHQWYEAQGKDRASSTRSNAKLDHPLFWAYHSCAS